MFATAIGLMNRREGAMAHRMFLLGIACLLIAVVLLTGGCEGIQTASQSKTVQGAAIGSALGAGTGAIIGHQTGHAGAGTAVGAGLGALAGGLVGSNMEAQDRKYSQQAYPPAAARTKFCPIGGEAYTGEFRYCPVHGAELQDKRS